MQEYNIKNLNELYNRIRPALYSKVQELYKLGYKIVNEKDIWDYLLNKEWKKRNDIDLTDIVNDILYLNNYEIYEHVLNKIKGNKMHKEEEIL